MEKIFHLLIKNYQPVQQIKYYFYMNELKWLSKVLITSDQQLLQSQSPLLPQFVQFLMWRWRKTLSWEKARNITAFLWTHLHLRALWHINNYSFLKSTQSGCYYVHFISRYLKTKGYRTSDRWSQWDAEARSFSTTCEVTITNNPSDGLPYIPWLFKMITLFSKCLLFNCSF